MPATEVGKIRNPVRPLSTTNVAMAFPGELLVDPKSGGFIYVTPEGTHLTHRKPGTLTLRYGETVLCNAQDLADAIDLTIPAVSSPGKLTIKYGSQTLVNAQGMDNDISVTIPEPSVDVSTLVPITRTINGHALSGDLTLTAADVGARPATWVPTAADVGAVPTTRTINGKALSANISLTATDVGAIAPGYAHNIGAVISNLSLSTTWSGSAAPYTQSLTVSGLLATDVPTVDFRATGVYATDTTAEEAWLNIYRIVSATNTLTFYARSKPTVAIPITIKFT